MSHHVTLLPVNEYLLWQDRLVYHGMATPQPGQWWYPVDGTRHIITRAVFKGWIEDTAFLGSNPPSDIPPPGPYPSWDVYASAWPGNEEPPA